MINHVLYLVHSPFDYVCRMRVIHIVIRSHLRFRGTFFQLQPSMTTRVSYVSARSDGSKKEESVHCNQLIFEEDMQDLGQILRRHSRSTCQLVVSHSGSDWIIRRSIRKFSLCVINLNHHFITFLPSCLAARFPPPRMRSTPTTNSTLMRRKYREWTHASLRIN